MFKKKYYCYIIAISAILFGCYVLLLLNKRASNPEKISGWSIASEIAFGLLPSFHETDVRIDRNSSKSASKSWSIYFLSSNERRFCLPNEIKTYQKKDHGSISVFYLVKNASHQRHYIVIASNINEDYAVIVYDPDWSYIFMVSSKKPKIISAFDDNNNYYKSLLGEVNSIDSPKIFYELYPQSQVFAFLDEKGSLVFEKHPHSSFHDDLPNL